MTTKKARSRRLARSENRLRAPFGAKHEERITFVNSEYSHPATLWVRDNWRKRPPNIGWSAQLYENGLRHLLFAKTRLALHDAILRAGWPSPWWEVKATVGTIVVDHVEPMERFVRRAEKLKSGGHCTPSATSPKLIAQSDMPAGTVVNRNGARAVAGEIPFGVAPVALRKGEAFAPKRNNVEEP